MSKEPLEHTITRENNGSVWVNGKHNCLARFTRKGWEIYQNMDAPIEVIGTTKTLDVQAKPTDERSWKSFCILLKSHHGIDLSGEEYPKHD